MLTAWDSFKPLSLAFLFVDHAFAVEIICSVSSMCSTQKSTMNLADFIAAYYKAHWFKQGIIHFEVEMKAVHPLRPWMSLRATCRRVVRACIVAMTWRAAFLKNPNYVHNNYRRLTQLQRLNRIQQSGWLFQLWFPDGTTIRSQLPRRGLLFNATTYRPDGMSESYWEDLCGRVAGAVLGWQNGKLQL